MCKGGLYRVEICGKMKRKSNGTEKEGTSMEMEQQFHTALFGGFRRQDVLTYIETTARAHAQDMEVLNTQLDKARQQAEEASERALQAEAKAAELEPRAAQMEKTTAELEDKRSRLAAAEREVRELKAELAVLTPKAEAYEAVKDKTAGIELEAHQRAKQVVAEAERQAKQVYDQTEQWLGKVRGSYELLRTDISATMTHTAGELDRAGKALADANREFREHDDALKRLAHMQKSGSTGK